MYDVEANGVKVNRPAALPSRNSFLDDMGGKALLYSRTVLLHKAGLAVRMVRHCDAGDFNKSGMKTSIADFWDEWSILGIWSMGGSETPLPAVIQKACHQDSV